MRKILYAMTVAAMVAAPAATRAQTDEPPPNSEARELDVYLDALGRVHCKNPGTKCTVA